MTSDFVIGKYSDQNRKCAAILAAARRIVKLARMKSVSVGPTPFCLVGAAKCRFQVFSTAASELRQECANARLVFRSILPRLVTVRPDRRRRKWPLHRNVDVMRTMLWRLHDAHRSRCSGSGSVDCGSGPGSSSRGWSRFGHGRATARLSIALVQVVRLKNKQQ